MNEKGINYNKVNGELKISYPNLNELAELYEFLAEEGIIESGEVEENMLLFDGGKIYFLPTTMIRELINNGEIVLQQKGMLEDYINPTNKNHLEFYKWYHNVPHQSTTLEDLVNAINNL